ncbi:MAG TPA: NADPH:quinone oxidoreductase family protein [Acidimicrobiales bacterium]|nr:NADPH:quinone oxidoreductase family protein [Acidimicrobiales bacterium]
MRRVVCMELGPLENLVMEEVEPLLPAPHQVVVDVEAAGATFVDALIAQGGYQLKPPTPYSPGGEVAGIVSAVGDEVDGVDVGDRVLAQCGVGGFASQVAVPASATVPVPDGVSPARAATMLQSYATAVFALTHRILTQPGETCLVLGAGGGVGLAAIDVARALGLHTIAAASTEDKLTAAKTAGAEMTIDYTSEDLREVLRGLPDGGVDIVVDPVGGANAEKALRSLRPSGRYLTIGYASGEIPSLPLNHVLLTNRAVVGVDWGAWAAHEPEANRTFVGEIVRMVADRKLCPPEPMTQPLEEASEVLQAFLDRRVVGKVALVP